MNVYIIYVLVLMLQYLPYTFLLKLSNMTLRNVTFISTINRKLSKVVFVSDMFWYSVQGLSHENFGAFLTSIVSLGIDPGLMSSSPDTK
jgi:hypothetical protein